MEKQNEEEYSWKDTLLGLLIVVLIVFGGFKMCNGCGSSGKKNVETREAKANKDPYAPNIIAGDYEMYDGTYTWIISMNEDETCVIRISGYNNTYYGSWMKVREFDSVYSLDFGGDGPRIHFGLGETNTFGPYLDFKDMYFYKDHSAIHAKNPEKRIRMKRK